MLDRTKNPPYPKWCFGAFIFGASLFLIARIAGATVMS